MLANQYRIDDERVLRGERILSRIELVGRFDHTARWCVTSKAAVFPTVSRAVAANSASGTPGSGIGRAVIGVVGISSRSWSASTAS